MRNESRGSGSVSPSGFLAATFGFILAFLPAPDAGAQPETPSPGFAITTSITTFPGCSEPALLYPGVERCLSYTVHNSLEVPISVDSLQIADVEGSSRCPRSNLDLSRATFSGSLEVPARGSASSPGLPIALVETGTNQDACQGSTFSFGYVGTALTADPTEVEAAVIGRGADTADRPDTPTGRIPLTGTDVLRLVAAAAVLLSTGAILILGARTRNREPDREGRELIDAQKERGR